ncbi:hypothetical protein Tcan_00076 [Toxocara canis]|uniref:Uncharacterized protein n=1 Tax=Toxocara canis TaxID=6265 RepID=A0A0B2V7G3_TOXCA|nr:hypothetical protein Tcan_00076 [Toxocara canis]
MLGYFFIPVVLFFIFAFVILSLSFYRYNRLRRSGGHWSEVPGCHDCRPAIVVIAEPYPYEGNAFPAQTSYGPPYPAYPTLPVQPSSQSSNNPATPNAQHHAPQIGFISQDLEAPPPPYPGIINPSKNTS